MDSDTPQPAEAGLQEPLPAQDPQPAATADETKPETHAATRTEPHAEASAPLLKKEIRQATHWQPASLHVKSFTGYKVNLRCWKNADRATCAAEPTPEPTPDVTPEPTPEPTLEPTLEPTANPTEEPSQQTPDPVPDADRESRDHHLLSTPSTSAQAHPDTGITEQASHT